MSRHEDARPTINHIYVGNNWELRTFLPIFDALLIWAEDMRCPQSCPLATSGHPMVRDERNEHVYHKLCTLTVIKAGLMTRKEADTR